MKKNQLSVLISGLVILAVIFFELTQLPMVAFAGGPITRPITPSVSPRPTPKPSPKPTPKPRPTATPRPTPRPTVSPVTVSVSQPKLSFNFNQLPERWQKVLLRWYRSNR